MRKIIVKDAPFEFGNEDLPIMVHGQEGSGASLFSIIIAATYCRQGTPLFFWSAYPMAKQELRHELAGASESPLIVMESGDPQDLAEALPSLDENRILFVKNFETLPAELQSRVAARTSVIVSGDLDGLAAIGDGSAFRSRFFFSPFASVSLPKLEKYQSAVFSAKGNGVARLA